jgi:hypothetical protein
VAQVNPAASKVVPADAPPEAAAEPEAIAEPDAMAEPAAEVADPAADVAAAAADDVLVELLSLPHALRVNAPTARRAISPLIRVIFTQEPPLTSNRLVMCARSAARPDTGWRLAELDAKGRGWTADPAKVNGG